MVTVGAKGTALLAPPVQVKVSAPPPLSVTELPIHTAGLLAEAVTTGKGFTVTETEARLVLVQPVRVFVPLTE